MFMANYAMKITILFYRLNFFVFTPWTLPIDNFHNCFTFCTDPISISNDAESSIIIITGEEKLGFSCTKKPLVITLLN